MVGSAVPCPDQGTDYLISNLKMSVLGMDVNCGISILLFETYMKFKFIQTCRTLIVYQIHLLKIV